MTVLVSVRRGSTVYHRLGGIWPTACKAGHWWPGRWSITTRADAAIEGLRPCLRCKP